MLNYQNGKIYKLICSQTNRIYIGSTVAKLGIRKSQHIHSSNTCCSKDFINPEIYLLEKYPCNNKEELHSKEREYIENTDCVNKQLPGRTLKEWREANKGYIKEYYEKNKEELNKKHKKYNEDNKEIINKQKKEHYRNNKEALCKISREYREANKEKVNKKSREYHEKNKEELNKKKREKMTCKCGSIFTRSNKSQHLKSKKHQIFTIKNLI